MVKYKVPEDWHRQDIIAFIRKKKKSLSALSRENNLASGTLINALVRHWPKGERIIANVLGLDPKDVWPSRYRGKNRKLK